MTKTEQLQQLWEYQKFDLKLDQIDAQLKKKPSRQKLVQARNTLKETQDYLAKLEGDLVQQNARLTHLRAEMSAWQKKFDLAVCEPEVLADMSAQELAALKAEASGMLDEIGRLAKEIERFTGELTEQQNRIQSLRIKAARAKKDYPVLKEEYAREMEQFAPQIDELRAKRDAIGEHIDEDLLNRYRNIKRQRPAPLARIVERKCSGCNMDIASLVLRNARSADQIIECENCGRILLCE